MKHIPREEYLKQLREKRKELIKQLIDIFFIYDGDYKTLGEQIKKSKATISSLLNDNNLIDEMIKEGTIDPEVMENIRNKLEKNKEIGRKKGGDNFKERYEVEYNESRRIVSHTKK